MFDIKSIRLKENITQERLSEISGVSRAIIAGLESGARTNTSTDTLYRIAKALNVDISDIFLPDSSNGLDENDNHNKLFEQEA